MKGKLRVVFKQFPLTSIHPNARGAGIASLAADKQGKFWPYHDRLFEDTKKLGPADLVEHATALGLSIPQFEQDLKDPMVIRQMQIDKMDAMRAGVRGTPTMFLNGRRVLSTPTSTDAIISLIESEVFGKK